MVSAQSAEASLAGVGEWKRVMPSSQPGELQALIVKQPVLPV